MSKPFFLVDSFSDKAFSGNPAGVVLDCADLDSKTLQRIAAELGYPATAFPLPAREPQSAFHLRWFTPDAELGFCGHGALAALHVLALEAKRVRVAEQGVTRLSFTTKAGRLRAELSREAGRLTARFEAPPYRFERAMVGHELLATLGLIPELLDPNLVPAKAPRPGADSANLFVALRDRAALGRARCDFSAFGALARQEKIGSVTLYAVGPEAGADVQLRYFNLHHEDAVTGSACAALALLLQERLPEEMPRTLRFSQGAEVGRPGRAEVQIRPEQEPGEIRGFIAGAATVVLRGELELPK